MKRILVALLLSAFPAHAEFVLQLPLGAAETYAADETTLPAQVPAGPAVGSKVPMTPAPGSIRRTVWQVGPEQTVQEVERNIAEQLGRRGYEVVFDCVTAACGGFDFRFGIDVVPEPIMRVDLRDFRFITAKQSVSDNPDYVTFLISKSPVAVYVQLTEYRSDRTDNLDLQVQTTSSALLDAGAKMVLEGLVFGSGGTAVTADPNGTLTKLADLMKGDETLTVLLVGHSDNSGTLEGNLIVSKSRAAAVEATLIEDYGISADRLSAYGVAFLSPRATNDTDAGQQKNRRVEAVFSR
ncbi:MAG: OmpA family protein [Pseudomonadota bacterium]